MEGLRARRDPRAHAAGGRDVLKVGVGEGDADVADVAAARTDQLDRLDGAGDQRVGVVDHPDDGLLVIHDEQGGAPGVDRGCGIGHSVASLGRGIEAGVGT